MLEVFCEPSFAKASGLFGVTENFLLVFEFRGLWTVQGNVKKLCHENKSKREGMVQRMSLIVLECVDVKNIEQD